MHDPVEIRRRIERLLRRIERRDDYGALLNRGDVVRRIDEVDDVEAWRAEIRRQARADRIGVRTGREENVVYALLADGETEQRRQEGTRYQELLATLVPIAVALRHEPSVLARDGEEFVLSCDRCSALAYGDAADGVNGGALIEDPCPHEEEPLLTALAFMHGTFMPRNAPEHGDGDQRSRKPLWTASPSSVLLSGETRYLLKSERGHPSCPVSQPSAAGAFQGRGGALARSKC